MNVYQNLDTVDETSLRPGTKRLPFKIRSASLSPGAYYGKDALVLDLIEVAENGRSCSYGLVGLNMAADFVEDMGVKGIEGLVGKDVFGFVHRDDPLQGVRPNHK